MGITAEIRVQLIAVLRSDLSGSSCDGFARRHERLRQPPSVWYSMGILMPSAYQQEAERQISEKQLSFADLGGGDNSNNAASRLEATEDEEDAQLPDELEERIDSSELFFSEADEAVAFQAQLRAHSAVKPTKKLPCGATAGPMPSETTYSLACSPLTRNATPRKWPRGCTARAPRRRQAQQLRESSAGGGHRNLPRPARLLARKRSRWCWVVIWIACAHLLFLSEVGLPRNASMSFRDYLESPGRNKGLVQMALRGLNSKPSFVTEHESASLGYN